MLYPELMLIVESCVFFAECNMRSCVHFQSGSSVYVCLRKTPSLWCQTGISEPSKRFLWKPSIDIKLTIRSESIYCRIAQTKNEVIKINISSYFYHHRKRCEFGNNSNNLNGFIWCNNINNTIQRSLLEYCRSIWSDDLFLC